MYLISFLTLVRFGLKSLVGQLCSSSCRWVARQRQGLREAAKNDTKVQMQHNIFICFDYWIFVLIQGGAPNIWFFVFWPGSLVFHFTLFRMAMASQPCSLIASSSRSLLITVVFVYLSFLFFFLNCMCIRRAWQKSCFLFSLLRKACVARPPTARRFPSSISTTLLQHPHVTLRPQNPASLGLRCAGIIYFVFITQRDRCP
jgi:hypothetical protein